MQRGEKTVDCRGTWKERGAAPKWEPAVTEETEKLLGGAEKMTGLRSNGKTSLWIRRDLA